jgi:two-component system phosphate regulon sensor histidine kinase PhoR
MIVPRGSLQARVFLAFVLVTVLAAGLPLFLARGSLYEARVELAGSQALAQARVLKGLYESGLGDKQLAALLASLKAVGARLTVLDQNGMVIHDSHVDGKPVRDLDDHSDRPEIEAARSVGHGISLRHSNTLDIDAVYAAVPLADGAVLRLGVPLANIRLSFEREFGSLALGMAGVIVFCLILSSLLVFRLRKGVDSMAEMVADISRSMGKRRLLGIPGKEFLPLAYAVNRMSENIEDYVKTTTDQHTQLEVILNSISEGILVFGPGGNIRRFNRAMSELFPQVGEAVGKQLIEAVPLPALQRKLETLLNTPFPDGPEAPVNCEGIQIESGGRFLMAHLSRPVEKNESLGGILVVYDATELMRLERIRRDFVANISHELRTPLSAITGYAETMMDMEELDPAHKNFAAIIYKHSHILAKVVNDLLNLARIEDAQESIPLEPVDPLDALRESLALSAALAEKKGLRFVVEHSQGLRVMGNTSYLIQVFRNLLENACRYSPEGGSVVITAEEHDGRILFAVKDQGPGIATDELPRIFERLYQVKKQRNSGASGIGLAICKHIVERHGGTIWVESPYQGFATAMLFTLPAAGGTEGDS